MNASQNWLHPRWAPQSPTEPQNSSRRSSRASSPGLKPQNLISSVKSLVHRKTRSAGDIRLSRSLQEINITHTHWPPRSRSLNSAQKPATWTQRGMTPGMDDYLTLAELEGVWTAQDSYVGAVQAPQRPSAYTFEETAEVPTAVQHKPEINLVQPKDDAMKQRTDIPKLRITTDVGTSLPAQRLERSQAVPRSTHPPARIPIILPQINTPSTASSSTDLPSTTTSTPLTIHEVRNAVISGIIHPAFRPQPYLSDMADGGNCRVTSRFAVEVPSSNWTYGCV